MTATTVVNPSTVKTQTRLLSLDVLRGITIAFMVLVNNNGDERAAYWPLKHAEWNGWTPTDLIFPTFLFIAGLSLAFSFESRLAKGATRMSLFLHAVKRSIILFLLGLFGNGFPLFHLSTMRIYGVLQRFAVVLLIASMIYLLDRGLKGKIAILIGALLAYWIIMRWIPVPDYGLPGRDIPFLDKDANWVAYIDRHIFPAVRLYEHTRDPEGLLSNLPALGTALLGMLTATWLRTKNSLEKKCAGLFIAALTGLALGAIWGHWFPINKKLWTSSYVLFAAGWSLLSLAICYWLIEIKQWKGKWTFPWLVLGSNAIAVYVFADFPAAFFEHVHFGKQSSGVWLYTHVFSYVQDAAFRSLLFSLMVVVICFIPALILYRKKIFIKI